MIGLIDSLQKSPKSFDIGAFSFIYGAPAPFEPGGDVAVFRGLGLLRFSEGYTRGYTVLSAGVFSAGFTRAEKAVEIRCSIPDERYRDLDKPAVGVKKWSSPLH